MPLGVPNLASTVESFSVPTTRIEIGAPATTNVDGFPVDDEVTVSTILAHTFPAPGAQVVHTADGQEAVDKVESHTTADLHVAVEATGQRGSRIVFAGNQYEVQSVGPRATGPTGVITWRIATAVLVPPVELPP